MIQLAYVSSTRGLLNAEEILDILVSSREKNTDRGITGMLLYKGGNVLQIIEGQEAQVIPLFEMIQKDGRHGGVIKLYMKNIQVREFPEWAMGFQDLGSVGVRELPGFSDILDPDFDMRTISPSAASSLLGSFKSGMR